MSTASLGPLLRVSARLQSGTRTASSSGVLTGEESISESVLVADRVRFLRLYDEGLQFFLPVPWGYPPLLEAACSFLAWWVPHRGPLILVTCFLSASSRESLTLTKSPHPLYKPPLIKRGLCRKIYPLSNLKPIDLGP